MLALLRRHRRITRSTRRPAGRKLISARGSELDLSFSERIEDLRRVGAKETSALTRKLIESLDTMDDMELTALRIPKRSMLRTTVAYGGPVYPPTPPTGPTGNGQEAPDSSPAPSPTTPSPAEPSVSPSPEPTPSPTPSPSLASMTALPYVLTFQADYSTIAPQLLYFKGDVQSAISTLLGLPLAQVNITSVAPGSVVMGVSILVSNTTTDIQVAAIRSNLIINDVNLFGSAFNIKYGVTGVSAAIYTPSATPSPTPVATTPSPPAVPTSNGQEAPSTSPSPPSPTPIISPTPSPTPSPIPSSPTPSPTPSPIPSPTPSPTPSPSTANLTALPFVLTFQADYNNVAAQLQSFKADVQSAISSLLGLPLTQVNITSVAPGSVVVGVSILVNSTAATASQISAVGSNLVNNASSLFGSSFTAKYGVTGVSAAAYSPAFSPAPSTISPTSSPVIKAPLPSPQPQAASMTSAALITTALSCLGVVLMTNLLV